MKQAQQSDKRKFVAKSTALEEIGNMFSPYLSRVSYQFTRLAKSCHLEPLFTYLHLSLSSSSSLFWCWCRFPLLQFRCQALAPLLSPSSKWNYSCFNSKIWAWIYIMLSFYYHLVLLGIVACHRIGGRVTCRWIRNKIHLFNLHTIYCPCNLYRQNLAVPRLCLGGWLEPRPPNQNPGH